MVQLSLLALNSRVVAALTRTVNHLEPNDEQRSANRRRRIRVLELASSLLSEAASGSPTDCSILCWRFLGSLPVAAPILGMLATVGLQIAISLDAPHVDALRNGQIFTAFFSLACTLARPAADVGKKVLGSRVSTATIEYFNTANAELQTFRDLYQPQQDVEEQQQGHMPRLSPAGFQLSFHEEWEYARDKLGADPLDTVLLYRKDLLDDLLYALVDMGAIQHTESSLGDTLGLRKIFGKCLRWLPVALPVIGVVVIVSLVVAKAREPDRMQFLEWGQVYTIGSTLLCASARPIGDYCMNRANRYSTITSSDRWNEVIAQLKDLSEVVKRPLAHVAQHLRLLGHTQGQAGTTRYGSAPGGTSSGTI